MIKLGLALGGGGAKGSYQIGVLKALYETKLLEELKVVAGTSIGAINACMIMESLNFERLTEIWEAMNNATIYSGGLSRFKQDKLGLFDQSIMYNILAEKQPVDAIKNSKIIGYAAVTKITNYKLTKQLNKENMVGELICLNEIEDPHKMVLASASVPIVFGPTEIAGEFYVDGGIFNNLPVDALIKEKCDVILAIGLDTNHDLTVFNDGRTLIVDLSPDRKLSKSVIGMLDFNPKVVKKRMQLGYDNAKRMITYLTEQAVIKENKWQHELNGIFNICQTGNKDIQYTAFEKGKADKQTEDK